MIDDYKSTVGSWARYGYREGKRQVTYSYSRWNSMQSRCTEGSATQIWHPTYIGCTVSPLFADFQLFADWHGHQIGYGEQGYEIDKDILINGNKLYSETTCVLVPKTLNTWLLACNTARGEFPQGVSWHRRDQKFQASMSIDGKKKHLGYHTSVDAASSAYKAAKEAEASRWYERLRDGEFIVDPRVIERMKNWKLDERSISGADRCTS